MRTRLILIATLLSLFLTHQTFSKEVAKINEPAPDFILTDINGIEHRLSDYLGKYIIIEWVNFDCPFVKKHYETNNMQAVQKMMIDEGHIWLSVCSSAPGKQGFMSNEDVKKRIEQLKSIPTAYLDDSEGDVGRLYAAKTTPDIRIISPEGILIYSGAIDNIPSVDKSDIGKAENYIVRVFKQIDMNRTIDPNVTKPYGCSVKYDR